MRVTGHKLGNFSNWMVTSKDYVLGMTFKGKTCVRFNSNLPYEKEVKHFDFYSKAVTLIIKKLKK